jgi:hypothetical protein
MASLAGFEGDGVVWSHDLGSDPNDAFANNSSGAIKCGRNELQMAVSTTWHYARITFS